MAPVNWQSHILVSCVRRCALSEFVQSRLKSVRKLLSRSRAPVVEKVDRWLSAGHVIVDCHHVQPVRTESLQNRSHLLRQHRDVPRYLGVGVRAEKRRPCVQAHACVDRRTHFFQVDIVTPYCDLVDLTVLLAFMPD